jgi:superfamily II DNA or RNA helicase
VSLIQGPPGTGKTFLGNEIVRLMLEMQKDMYAPPIMLTCYTNHALDQFLSKIMEYTPEGIIRLGGGSKDERMKQFQLIEFKKKNKISLYTKEYRQFKD